MNMKKLLKKLNNGAKWYFNQLSETHPEWKYGIYVN